MGRRVFAIFAHPDDIEFCAAGTLLLLSRAGWELHYLNLADGSCGSMETDGPRTAAIRLEEAKAAAAELGAVFHPPLVPDMQVFYDHSTLSRLGSLLREVVPDIVLTHSPEDYMEDHSNTSRLAVSASFARCLPNYPVEPHRDSITSDVAVYHAQPHGNRDWRGQLVAPDFCARIDSVMERKVKALELHRSQRDWLDQTQGMDAYQDAMKGFCAEVAALSGINGYAEGWRQRHPLGFGKRGSDPLREALGDDVCEVMKSEFAPGGTGS